MNDDEADYCWCGTRMQYLQTMGRWLCSAHGYQDRAYGPTPPLPTIPHS
jgi:hypothetical protein